MTGRIPKFTALVCSLFVSLLAGQEAKVARSDDAPFAIPTFNCLGLYWSPPGGGADKEVLVRFRPAGATAWKEGLAMRYNPIPDTDEDLTDYRGSIVYLERAPATRSS